MKDNLRASLKPRATMDIRFAILFLSLMRNCEDRFTSDRQFVADTSMYGVNIKSHGNPTNLYFRDRVSRLVV